MIKLGVGGKLLLPFLIHFAIVIPLTYFHKLNYLEFLGLNFSLGLTLTFLSVITDFAYNTYIGVLLGHNVDLRAMGSWAVVTGATDGIGWAYCRELAKRGINVVLMSRTLERLEKSAAVLQAEFGVQTKVIQIDFSGDIDVYDKVDFLLAGLDVGTLINNVGMTYGRPTQFHELPDSKNFIHDMINLNVLAVTMMTRAVLPGMLRRGRGVVVNVGSFVTVHITPFYALYAASKAYMDKLTEDLSREYEHAGIIFQYQFPGYVCTKMSKISKASFASPSAEEYARLGMESIGLQKRTAVWLPHRAFIYGMSIIRAIIPKTGDQINTMAMRSYWLFAKRRELEKLNILYSQKIV